MFVKQIGMKEALRLVNSGIEVNVLVPMDSEGTWSGMEPTTLQGMLNGVLFFRREPAMENPEFELDALKQDPEEPEKESPQQR